MSKLLSLPDLLETAGIPFGFVDGWSEPRRPGYVWREPDAEAAAVMWHHTATSSYGTTGSGAQDKANLFTGIYRDGRLWQSGAGEPTVYLANAFPAPISSGAGRRDVLDALKRGVTVTESAMSPDTPDWYGNTHYVNIEHVLDGRGTRIREDVWNMLTRLGRCLDRLYGWEPGQRHIGHLQHTYRKIDLWDGTDPDGVATMNRLRDGIQTTTTEDGMPYAQFCNMVDSLFAGRPDMFKGDPSYFYRTVADGGIYDDPDARDWVNFWSSFTKAITPA